MEESEAESFRQLINLLIAAAPVMFDPPDPIPDHDSALTGQMYFDELMASDNPHKFRKIARMDKQTFLNFATMLIDSDVGGEIENYETDREINDLSFGQKHNETVPPPQDDNDDVDSLWGDDSVDENVDIANTFASPMSNAESIKICDKLSLSSPSPMKSIFNAETSEEEIDNIDVNDILGNNVDKKSTGKRMLKIKQKERKNDLPKMSSVEMEIAAVKKIEKGPSEADEQRRMLIEIDQDEMEERVVRLNKAAMRAISSSTGLTKQEQKRMFRECREFLSRHLKMPRFAETVRLSIEKQNSRTYVDLQEPAVDVLDYLLREDYSSDSSESEQEKHKPTMIALSDSDSDDETPVHVPSPTEKAALERRRAHFENAQKAKPNQRTQLLTILRKKVHETAGENYCHQSKIDSAELAVHLEVTEKTRFLVELLKERHETRALQQRVTRRARYSAMAGDEDEEFDSGAEEELGEGLFLSEADRAAIMRQLSGEEEEEEENVDDILSGNEEEEEETSQVEDVSSVLDSGSPQQSDKATEYYVMEGHEEGDETQMLSAPKSQSRRLQIVDDDADSNLERPTASAAAVVRQYGRRVHSEETTASDAAYVDGAEQVDVHVRELEVAMEPPVAKAKRAGNSLFRLQLEEEARRHRTQKKSALLDEEAEEEEEEGQQAGLGDFGFGPIGQQRDMDEEKDALNLRRGDLDHIVDDVSEGEGDEEEAVRARVDMEMREDKERTRAVITAVTEGHEAARKRAKKGKFSFERLVADKKKVFVAGEAAEEEEELDEEEMMQQAFAERTARERNRRGGGESSDSESDGFESDSEANINEIMDAEHMTDEQKRSEIALLNAQKEQDRLEALKRKQAAEYYRMRRELRRQASLSSSAVPTHEPSHNALLAGTVIKRRTSTAPKHIVPGSSSGSHKRVVNTLSKSRTIGSSGLPPTSTSCKLSRSASVTGRHSSLSSSSSATQLYRGELNQTEVQAGYGMGMVAASSGRSLIPNENSDSNIGLFSAVTGLKRTFSSAVGKKRPSTALGSTVTAHQYVFTSGGGSVDHEASVSHFAPSLMQDPNSNSAFTREAHSNSHFGSSGSSLLAKLGAQGGLKKTKSVGSFSGR